LIFLPTSWLAQNGSIASYEVSTNGGAYCITGIDEETGELILKTVGQAGNMKVRQEKRGVRIDPMVLLDLWPRASSDKFKVLYKQLMNKLMTSPKISHSNRRFYRRLHVHGGERLGPEKSLWRMLIEHSIKHHFHIYMEFEFLWDDPLSEKLGYEEAAKGADELRPGYRHIIKAEHDNVEDGYYESGESWEPEIEGYSTQFECAKAITGEGSVHDAINMPAIPNAKSSEDRYNTSEYTREQKKYGLSRTIQLVALLLLHHHGILYLDWQKLVFDWDVDIGNDVIGNFKSVHDVLRSFGFEQRVIVTGGFLIQYTKGNLHGVTVHGPWCLAGSSKSFNPAPHQFRAGIGHASCVNITRVLKKKPYLDSTVDWYNSIDGMHCHRKLSKSWMT